jgi:hypothetical protein
MLLLDKGIYFLKALLGKGRFFSIMMKVGCKL